MDVTKSPDDAVREAIKSIDVFIAPLLNPTTFRESSQTLTEILIASQPNASRFVDNTARKQILVHAGDLLLNLHNAFHDLQEHTKSSGTFRYNLTMFTAVFGLIDLLILEAVYPSMSHGICDRFKLQSSCVLFPQGVPRSAEPPDLNIIQNVVWDLLNCIALERGIGVQPFVERRRLIDLVAASGDLAFTRSRTEATKSRGKAEFRRLLSGTEVSLLYPILSDLIERPDAPACFTRKLKEALSPLPGRPNGVRTAVQFIATHYAANADRLRAQGYDPTETAIEHTTRAICTPPKGIMPDEWMKRICPQLLELIDSNPGPQLLRVISRIITRGILNKHTLGAPGCPGWRYLVEPCHRALMPIEEPTEQDPVVSEEELGLALARLYVYTTGNPSPHLIGRLIRPVLLPLWGLMNFADVSGITSEPSPNGSNPFFIVAFDLLKRFFRLAANVQSLENVLDDMMWEGTKTWMFVREPEGGVTLRSADLAKDSSIQSSLLHMNRRAYNFARLLSAAPIDIDILDPFLSKVLPRWLYPDHAEIDERKQGNTVIVAQAIVDMLKDIIASRPEKVLEIISEFFSHHLYEVERRALQKVGVENTVLFQKLQVAAPTEDEIMINNLNIELNDLTGGLTGATMALTSILSSSKFSVSESTASSLEQVASTLRKLLDVLPGNTSIITGLEVLLERGRDSEKLEDASDATLLNPFLVFRETAERFEHGVLSDDPANRASAIHDIEAFILNPKNTVVASTLAPILLQIICSDPEEFVHLRAINALVQLGIARDLRYVGGLLADSFHDVQEALSVDGRLRLGEALFLLVGEMAKQEKQAMHKNLRLVVVHYILKITNVVAGRRVKRMKERDDERKKARIELGKKREAERAWGGEVPELPLEPDTDDETQDLSAEAKQRRLEELDAAASILKGWQDTGFGEDIRVRASALSITGAILTHTLDDVYAAQLDAVVDLAVAVVTFEPQPSRAILRRAAVYVVFSLYRARHAALRDGGLARLRALPDIAPEKWDAVEKLMRLIRDVDGDQLTRGHAKEVADGLAEMRNDLVVEYELERIKAATAPDLGLEGGLRGLGLDPEPKKEQGTSKPKIEEVE